MSHSNKSLKVPFRNNKLLTREEFCGKIQSDLVNLHNTSQDKDAKGGNLE